MSFDWLPQPLGEIATVAGLPAALKLAEARGGTEIYIPAHAREGHWLVELVGREAAALMCRHFTTRRGGATIRLPLGPSGTLSQLGRLADKMIDEGRPHSEIARAVGMTTRAIERRAARRKGCRDPRQLDLALNPPDRRRG